MGFSIRVSGLEASRRSLLIGALLMWGLAPGFASPTRAGGSRGPVGVAAGSPAQTSYSEADVYTLYYDQDGRAGLVNAWQYPTSPTTVTDLYLTCGPGHVTVNMAYFSYTLPYGCTGSPFDFHIRVPGVGYYEGSSFVDKFYPSLDGFTNIPPVFIVPTTSERLGSTMILPSMTISVSYENLSYISLYPFVLSSDKLDACYGAYIKAFSSANNPCTITVEYLPGCSLYGARKRIVTIPYFSGIDVPYADIVWGGPNVEPYPPDVWTGDPVPSGPFRVTAKSDGYNSTSIVLAMDNHKAYTWRAPFVPTPGRLDVPRPTGLSFARAIPSWMVPLISEITNAILHSVSGPDENQDGVVDVTDILHVLKQGP